MCPDTIITVENLGKRYRIRHEAERYTALRDVIAQKAKDLFRRNGHPQPSALNAQSSREDFWALRNINFEVTRGEVLGIIGRNGAGKTTLLKILSRITEPTEGRVRIRGRVASLLEVGTGFHPELTGRENIFLNGAILGMSRAEIKAKFDEIVAFADVERFLDTPVKHYSSGMSVRLAFAVAAHLEPEILVVDEVLAVGDAQFQKKCISKMQHVTTSGRTVVFVSHNLPVVQQLCATSLLLRGGRVTSHGRTEEVLQQYLASDRSAQETALHTRQDRKGDGRVRFISVTLHDAVGNEIVTPLCGQSLVFRLHYESSFHGEPHNLDIAFNVRNQTGAVLTAFSNILTGQGRMALYPKGYFECKWRRINILAGTYVCALYCAVDGEVVDWLQGAFEFAVENGDFFGSGRIFPRDHGDLLSEHEWNSNELVQHTPPG